MDKNQTLFNEFYTSAVSAVLDAASFARDGDAMALQSVMNEIVEYYISSGLAEVGVVAGDILNAIDYTALTADTEMTREAVGAWLAMALSVPDEWLLGLGEAGEKSAETKLVDTEIKARLGEAGKRPAETGEGATTEISEATTEPPVFGLADALSGIKSQSDLGFESVLTQLERLSERLGVIERAFIVTAPAANPTENEPGQKTKVHRLKFGTQFKGGAADAEARQKEAIERMMKFGPKGGL